MKTKKINLTITGCLGRMGQQLIKSASKDKRFKINSLTENKLQRKKIIGILPKLNSSEASELFNFGKIPIIFFLCNLFSVRLLILNLLSLLADLINCCPILPRHPVIVKFIFLVFILKEF